MKIKLLVAILLTALVTLSFTFKSKNVKESKVVITATQNSGSEPAGGLFSEEK